MDTSPELGGMVLVMGVTGAGKSTFVNALKPDSVTVGHTLESTQAPPQAIQIFLDEEQTRSVTVVDTPGFDDTRRSNTQVLAEITEYLAAQYALQIPLRGIIYMHSINENRMKRSSRQFLEMFQLLCGDDALRKVKFVTTHWDNIETDREGEALRREQQLLDEWWAPMLEKGSSNTQFSGSHDSAEGIVLDLMSDDESIVLEVQRELVDCDMELGETKAGKSLRKVIEDDIAECKTSIDEIDTQMANATRSRRRSADDGKMARNQAEALVKQLKHAS
ncbi:P-loop containing nucleoside triphosphate hydrolase protein [Neurospora tetraspora]|uniref:P-loop containing nucleoside triphosphate hydrolase protein n=1 Tax=Neurospora tetraspora TaxID=94610 RepID=A0AAE0JBF1_9PEZI|nr:P-loop containing nucleoside triphosphate hydrolase protein [Neurospora tetraspora]